MLCSQIPDVVGSIAKALEVDDLDSAYRGVRQISRARFWPPNRNDCWWFADASGWVELGTPTEE